MGVLLSDLDEARRMTNFLKVNHLSKEYAVYIVWRIFAKDFYAEMRQNNQLWHKSDNFVNDHMRRYLRFIEEILKDEDGYDVILMSLAPDNKLTHGDRLEVNDKLTHAYYGQCIPTGGKSGKALAFGIFPPESNDHPLFLLTYHTRMKQASSTVFSIGKRMKHSEKTGTLSKLDRSMILNQAKQKCDHTWDGKSEAIENKKDEILGLPNTQDEV